jgi:hypothetical protein
MQLVILKRWYPYTILQDQTAAVFIVTVARVMNLKRLCGYVATALYDAEFRCIAERH